MPEVPAVAREWQAVATDCCTLIHFCGSPSHCLQRQGLASGGSDSPIIYDPFKNCALFPKQTTLPLGTFPAAEPLTPVSSVVFAQPTVVLSPDLLFQLHTLALRTHQHWQILLSSRGTHGWFLRKLWDGQCSGPWSLGERRPWLESWASLLRWVPFPVSAEADVSGWGRGQPYLFYATQQWLASMVSWAFSANLPSCGAHYSCPFRVSFHSQQLSLPLVHVPNYTSQHLAFLNNRGSVIQAGLCRAAAQTRPAVLSLPCCPQTIHCILLQSFKRPFLSQLISPLLQGEAFLREGTFPHLQLPTMVAGPIFDSSSLFSCLSSYQVVREFLLLF